MFTNKSRANTMFKNKPIDDRKTLVKAMVARMAKAYGVKKSALPDVINCQKSVINNWGYYGRIPYEYLEQCHCVTGVSMDWLLYAQQSKIEVNQQKLDELQTIVNKLLVDGEDFKMINQCYPGAAKQLSDKLEKDILKWLENNVQDDITKQQD